MERNSSTRRINFIAGEDFYFLAYSSLLVLGLLSGPKQRTDDHRKIAILIQFLADDRLISLLDRTVGRKTLNPVDRELLFLSYTNAELHKREIFKILFSLEKKGFVKLTRSDVAEVLDASLCPDELPEAFFDSPVFVKETENAMRIKKLFPKLSVMGLEKLVERIYLDRGVRVWVS